MVLIREGYAVDVLRQALEDCSRYLGFPSLHSKVTVTIQELLSEQEAIAQLQ
jgi:hypothetical protein